MVLGQDGRYRTWPDGDPGEQTCVLVTEVFTTTTVLKYEPDVLSRFDQKRASSMIDVHLPISSSSSMKSRQKLKQTSGLATTGGPRYRFHLTRRSLGLYLALGLFLFVLVKFLTAPFLRYNSTHHFDNLVSEDLPHRLHMSFTKAGVSDSILGLDSAHIPMLVPRVVHQMYSSDGLSRGIHELSGSWKFYNGEWDQRLYADDASLAMVKGEFPEYLDAYMRLPKGQRSYFFRFMVILRYGGVYADTEVECRRPLESLIRPTDTMVVGWDIEAPTNEMALAMGLLRRRQLHQMFFAAAPGHPALRDVCNHIAASTAQPLEPMNSNGTWINSPFRGIWTDVVLKHALMRQHLGKSGQQPWSVRILPRLAVMTDEGDLPSYTPQTTVIGHTFIREPTELQGVCLTWPCAKRWLSEKTSSFVPRGLWTSKDRPSVPQPAPVLHDESPITALFPVSVDFEPAFTLMVSLAGQGDTQWGEDVSAAITTWGTWQASIVTPLSSRPTPPPRKPRVIDAIIGALGNRSSLSALVDVGAAQGLFSLAGAARGHRVVAFETSGPSVASMRASVSYNALDALVEIHEVPLGARSETICLRRRSMLGLEDAADVDTRRGYGDSSLHAMSNPLLCEATAQRMTLPEALGHRFDRSAALGVEGSDGVKGSGAEAGSLEVGALRLSANGHEGWILQGAEEWMKHSPPGVVLVEFSPAKIRRSGYSNPENILRKLDDLGYSYVAHNGHVCDGRWKELKKYQTQDLSRESTWCRLQPDNYDVFVKAGAASGVTENVLFIHKNSLASTTNMGESNIK